MKLKRTILASLSFISIASPATADDSVQRASAASVGASLLAGSVVAWSAFETFARAAGDAARRPAGGTIGADACFAECLREGS